MVQEHRSGKGVGALGTGEDDRDPDFGGHTAQRHSGRVQFRGGREAQRPLYQLGASFPHKIVGQM